MSSVSNLSQTPVATQYQRLVDDEQIKPDEAQQHAAHRLDDLVQALSQAGRAKGWRRLVPQRLAGKQNPSDAVSGLYIYGAVGRGKSMLMDMFFDAVPVAAKRRVHFHAFMQETHQRIHQFRQKDKKGGDPMPHIAKQIGQETRLLCFDEFQVKDIADASILGRLFSLLLDQGICVVATSNRPPDDLYKGGLNRHRFLPFIQLLKARLDLLELQAAADYRLARLQAKPVWFTPCGPRARRALDERFETLTEGVQSAPMQLQLAGRTLDVAQTAGGVARLSFDDLCIEARGAADYLALAETFHTVLIDNIPRLQKDKRNEAVRFVTLIDALYENKVKILASADGKPQDLYPVGDEAFEFERTVSRLMEMQSRDYLALPHLGNA